jgi:hypothetical protein
MLPEAEAAYIDAVNQVAAKALASFCREIGGF